MNFKIAPRDLPEWIFKKTKTKTTKATCRKYRLDGAQPIPEAHVTSYEKAVTDRAGGSVTVHKLSS